MGVGNGLDFLWLVHEGEEAFAHGRRKIGGMAEVPVAKHAEIL